MKYIFIIAIVMSILVFSCNENKQESTEALELANYMAIIEEIDQLRQQNSSDLSPQLLAEIEELEKELLEKYPDMISTEEDVNKEGIY